MYPDLYRGRALVQAGAAAVMPLGSLIGSNRGLKVKEFIQILIDEINLPIVVDAGLGAPSHAAKPWKWAPMPCWSIRLWRQRGKSHSSPRLSRWPLRPAVWPI